MTGMPYYAYHGHEIKKIVNSMKRGNLDSTTALNQVTNQVAEWIEERKGIHNVPRGGARGGGVVRVPRIRFEEPAPKKNENEVIYLHVLVTRSIFFGILKTADFCNGKVEGTRCFMLCKAAQKITNLSVLCDCYQVIMSFGRDWENVSTRNTVQTLGTIVVAYNGKVYGASIGTDLGSVIHPVVGAWIGCVVGAVIGGFVGGGLAAKALNSMFDMFHYNIEWRKCKKCEYSFKCRRYEEGSQDSCRMCRSPNY